MIIGIIWGLYLNISVALILPIGVILIYFSRYKRIVKIFLNQILVFFIMFGIGAVYIKCENSSYEHIYGLQEIKTKAVVISEPIETNHRVKYTVKILSDNNLNNKKFIIQLKKNVEKLPYGALIVLKGEYSKPSSARNYGGFDYSNYLKTKQIYGVIEVTEVKILEENELDFISININKFRNIIINNSKQITKNSNASGMLIGILIGDTQNIDENTVNDFKNSSLAHLLAVSGQHITYMIIAIGFALKVSKMGKRSSYFVCIVVIILFTLLTGASAAVVRASIMGILMLLSKILYRKADIYSSLATSAILIFLNNPFAIYDIGLWLSFGGTFGIVLLNINIENSLKFRNNTITEFIKSALSVTISAQIFIIPIMLLNFNQLSTMFWLANILAAPIIGIVTIYGFIVIFVSLISTEIAYIFAIPLELLINALTLIANKVASIKFSSLLISTPSWIFVIAYYFTIFYVLFKRSSRKHNIEKLIINFLKKLLITILIILTISELITFLENKITVNFVDVGQGDSCLITTETGKKILIDGGGSENYDVGENVLLPYLLDRGVTTLDYVLISHFDSDHCKRNINNNG